MAKKKLVESPKPAKPSSDLESRIAILESKLSRALADYSNLEKRFDRESSTVIKFANSALINKLLELRDHLDSAAKHSSDQSLTMLLALFDKILEDEQVKKIDVSGQFDPSLMECQETVPGEKDKIISEARAGYLLHDRVLRPARVVVGDGTKSK